VNGIELKKSWRHRRLLLELKSLQQDPPDGINAKPLDTSCFFWQGILEYLRFFFLILFKKKKYKKASITGPHGSPYEGGIFFLYLRIPKRFISIYFQVIFV